MLIRTKEDLGKLVRDSRTAADMSGPELAEKADTGQAVISRVEHGRANVTLQTLTKLAKALGKRLYISFK